MAEKCPYCRSKKIVWRGYRYNKKSEKRLKLCKKCGRKFTPDDGFLRMRFHPKDITRAVSLYKKGMSSAEVRLHMQRQGIMVSRWTILCWVRRYG